jgi:Fe-S cluster assembly ATPase SufC
MHEMRYAAQTVMGKDGAYRVETIREHPSYNRAKGRICMGRQEHHQMGIDRRVLDGIQVGFQEALVLIIDGTQISHERVLARIIEHELHGIRQRLIGCF